MHPAHTIVRTLLAALLASRLDLFFVRGHTLWDVFPYTSARSLANSNRGYFLRHAKRSYVTCHRKIQDKVLRTWLWIFHSLGGS